MCHQHCCFTGPQRVVYANGISSPMASGRVDKEVIILVRKAYKKLKSYAYYDKNAFYLKRTIAEFEANEDPNNHLEQLAASLYNKQYYSEGAGNPVVLPKTVSTGNGPFHSNAPLNPKVDKIQCFAPMSIDDGIISVLWVMRIGHHIDKDLSDDVYGNRVNESYNTASPHLFKPFPFQYSAWRDNGLKAAIRCSEEKKECVFINTDFSSFFYNICLDDRIGKIILDKYCHDDFDRYLTELVFGFIAGYSKQFETPVLPIGYPPSNVISNFILSEFDRRIHDVLLPEYYGRYVDDIILVVRANLDDVRGQGSLDRFLQFVL